MKDRLLEIAETERARRVRAAAHYICPECWQRIAVMVALEEPPFCAHCGYRTMREDVPLASEMVAPVPPPPAKQTSFDL